MDELARAWIEFGIALNRDENIYPITITFLEDWTQIDVKVTRKYLDKYWDIQEEEVVLTAKSNDKIECLDDITKQISAIYNEY